MRLHGKKPKLEKNGTILLSPRRSAFLDGGHVSSRAKLESFTEGFSIWNVNIMERPQLGIAEPVQIGRQRLVEELPQGHGFDGHHEREGGGLLAAIEDARRRTSDSSTASGIQSRSRKTNLEQCPGRNLGHSEFRRQDAVGSQEFFK